MKAALFMGSDSDWPIMKPAVELLKEFGVEVDVIVASAHRTPAKVHEYAENARENGVGVIIAAAGAAGRMRQRWTWHGLLFPILWYEFDVRRESPAFSPYFLEKEKDK